MVGVGAIAGTLSGGYTNAARSPEASTGVAVDHAPVSSPVLARTVSVAPAESSPSQYDHHRHDDDGRGTRRAGTGRR